ncbi:hypothetical protein AB0L99_33215 [Streptomyces sp. NPDC051954]|uniref:hypothetical protein n=1 Tax=unclassified Streptomyces TaxID=2593676 RepID=UPI00342E2FEF
MRMPLVFKSAKLCSIAARWWLTSRFAYLWAVVSGMARAALRLVMITAATQRTARPANTPRTPRSDRAQLPSTEGCA